MNNRIVETSILAISFIIFGLIVRSSLIDMNSIKRTVTVKGFSERLVKADKATWPLSYTVSGNDLVSLYKSVEKKNTIIIKFLKDNGIRTRVLGKISDGSTDIQKALKQGHIAYVINTSDVAQNGENTDGYRIRKMATENNITMFTALDTVKVLVVPSE